MFAPIAGSLRESVTEFYRQRGESLIRFHRRKAGRFPNEPLAGLMRQFARCQHLIGRRPPEE
jgi:hypothetical protein